MPKKIVLALVLGALLFTSSQADDFIPASEAEDVARELVERIRAHVSNHPERAHQYPELSGASLAEPLLVHDYPGLKPCYYVVPAVNPQGKTTFLMGTSAQKREWQWFTRTGWETFPKVNPFQALQICQGRAGDAAVSQPKVVEMPNKKTYWLCLVEDSDLKEIFVDLQDPTEVYTNLDADISALSTSAGPTHVPGRIPDGPIQIAPDKNPTYPDAYNIENVPFYYQETYWYCCEATLEMVFDYWGPDISQDHICDVANATSSTGTQLDDARRASHFSYISTAIQNPSLQGYNERDFGYSSCEVEWSDPEHFADRYSDLKELISNDYPIAVATWFSASHSAGHCRVVKGYDDDLDCFLVHDPWYNPPYSGPDVHFNQTFFVDDLWVCYNRWGLLSVPWQIDYHVPSYVFAGGDTLRIEVSFTYTAPHPFEGQFDAYVRAAINVPDGYFYYPPTNPEIIYSSEYSGFSADTCWELICLYPKPEPDTFRVEVTGNVCGSSNSYPSYEDMLGGALEKTVYALHFLCGDVNADRWVDLSDVVYLLNYLYRDGESPIAHEMADVNEDHVLDLADLVYLINYLYKGGPDPCE